MNGVALLSDLSRAFHPDADPRNVAMIRRRHGYWNELARLRGWDLSLVDAETAEGAGGRVCWIDLPMVPRRRYREIFARAVALGAESVSQHPDEVESVLGLDRFYPVLAGAGVPTPRTAFVPVDEELAAAIDSPSAVRALLTEHIYGALFDAGLDPHQGVYVRGYDSSAKSANPEHYFGDNQADLEATTFEVIRRLRSALDVGGLALREHLDLERIELPAAQGARGGARLPFEVRLSVLGRRALMASYHGPFEALTEEAQQELGAALRARDARVREALGALTPTLLAADLPESYVADIAFPRDREAVVLELNPLYAAGHNVPVAHALLVAALGAALVRRADGAARSWEQVRGDAAALVGERVEGAAGVWLFDPLPSPP